MRTLTAVVVALLIGSAAPAAAQSKPGGAPRVGGTIVTINPLGFAQFGPNLEVQPIIGRVMGVALGVRVPYLGLIPHLMASEDNGSLGFIWMATAAVVFYPGQQAPRGWYVGPRFEIGSGTSEDDYGHYKDTPLMAGIDFGYRWMWQSGFNLSVGGQSGVISSSWKCDAQCTGDQSGTDIYPFAMAVLALGMRF
jgi:hypothetical protein